MSASLLSTPQSTGYVRKLRKGLYTIPLWLYISLLLLLPGSYGACRQQQAASISHKDSAWLYGQLQQGDRQLGANADTAIMYYRRALSFCRSSRQNSLAALVAGKLGNAYRLKGDGTQAVYFLEKALQYAGTRQSAAFRLNTYNDLSAVYSEKGVIYLSMLNLYKALDLVHKYPDIKRTRYAVAAYINMGGLWLDLEEPQKAMQYLDTALHMARNANDTSAESAITINLARMEYDNNRDVAGQYLQDLLRRGVPGLGKDWQIAVQANLGRILVEEGQANQGLQCLEESLRKGDSMQAGRMSRLVPQLDAAFAYIHLKRYSQADSFLGRLIPAASAQNELPVLQEAYMLSAKVAAATGQFGAAYKQQSQYQVLKDSLRRMGREKSMDFLLDYYNKEKDKELALKQLQISRQRGRIQQQYLYIAGIVFCILLLSTLLYRRRQGLAQQELKAALAGEEKERVRMARELHDGIVNQLSIVSVGLSSLGTGHPRLQADEQFREHIAEIDRAIAELRATSHNLLPEILHKAGLAETIRIYCEKVSQVSTLKVGFQMVGILPELTADFELNVYRAIQEVVHHLGRYAGATQAYIQLHASADWLEVSIEDNGPLQSGQGWCQEWGVGLFNVQSRVLLLNGTINVEQAEGTAIYLEFDLKKKGA